MNDFNYVHVSVAKAQSSFNFSIQEFPLARKRVTYFDTELRHNRVNYARLRSQMQFSGENK